MCSLLCFLILKMLAKLTERTFRLEALYICFCVLWQNVCVAFFQPAPADHVSSSKTKRKSSLLTSLKQLVWPVNSLVSSKVTSLHELLFCLCFFFHFHSLFILVYGSRVILYGILNVGTVTNFRLASLGQKWKKFNLSWLVLVGKC